jgi:predicted MarR family transcription regulator
MATKVTGINHVDFSLWDLVKDVLLNDKQLRSADMLIIRITRGIHKWTRSCLAGAEQNWITNGDCTVLREVRTHTQHRKRPDDVVIPALNESRAVNF